MVHDKILDPYVATCSVFLEVRGPQVEKLPPLSVVCTTYKLSLFTKPLLLSSLSPISKTSRLLKTKKPCHQFLT